MKRLYHKEVFWKSYFNKASGRIVYNPNIDLSKHLCERCFDNDKRHNFSLMKLAEIVINIRNGNQYYWIYEVETEYDNNTHSERIVKVVIRTEYNKKYDISIVYSEQKIKTAWLNKKVDKHNSLDYNKYYKP